VVVSPLSQWISLPSSLLLFLLLAPGAADARQSDAPLVPPEPASVRTRPQAPLNQEGELSPAATPRARPPQSDGIILDGQVRYGAFLSGPGSLTFILHHTLLGALGGLATQGISHRFSFERQSREAMLAGTLLGAGLGFGSSAWWQFNNWVGQSMPYFGIANSVMGGMFMGGFMSMLTKDPTLLAWSSLLGAGTGAWLTAAIGGGQLPLEDGLMVASGGAWGLIYGALLMSVIHFSGTRFSPKTWTESLLMAPGIGATALALATLKYEPTQSQILRANLFGGGVGAVVLVLSALVLGGFDQPTPYVLSFLGSAAAITTVSLLWEEAAERPRTALSSGSSKGKPYRCVWW
jgi:hypothetical protein